MWEVIRTEEFILWVSSLDDDAKEAIFKHVTILKRLGPSLGRPYVDTIKGSKFTNLKELRIQNKKRVFRIFFVFDPNRNIFLILGGDKKSNSRFYEEMISKVEKLYSEHLRQLGEDYEKKKS
jgi:hypothetical protein